jgi:hypothetical protein
MPTADLICEWEEESTEAQKWEYAPEDPKLQAEIHRAAEVILNLEYNWDGEGSMAFSERTFDRAVAFLVAQSYEVYRRNKVHPPVPSIEPGPAGSIDLHWQQPNLELLVNIPANPDALAAFYGDNYGSQTIKGSFDPKGFKREIITWLMNK